jgi:hypothetical protein
MLQKGRYVADIAYLLNEGAPSTMPFWGGGLQPATPAGYQFDYINADVLLNNMSVDERGKLVLHDGMTYSVLVLPQTTQMSLPVLKKIKALLEGGAVVVGPRPVAVPGLAGSDAELKELAFDIWGDLDGVSRTKRSYGKGKLAWGLPLQMVLKDIPKDASFNADVAWIHRRDGAMDIYYVVNRSNAPLDLLGTFNIKGRDVELWHADKGNMEPAAYTLDSNATTVHMPLEAHEAVFVVFGNKPAVPARSFMQKQYTLLADIKGTWELSFPKGFGAPEHIQLPQLASWTKNSNEGVKYFSGTGVYTIKFDVKKQWQNIVLDLGDVKDMAEVFVNGKRMDLLWKAPFTVDISSAVKPGSNNLEIRVTNEWTNRIRGDQDNPAKKVLASTPVPFGRRQYELAESGLIGPVKLLKKN